jgi:hypothetical protein
MKLYHGTKALISKVAEWPKATKAANGLGFYLTDNREIAEAYGKVIEYVVSVDYKVELMRRIEVINEKGIEYVLSQREADELVVDHALEINY